MMHAQPQTHVNARAAVVGERRLRRVRQPKRQRRVVDDIRGEDIRRRPPSRGDQPPAPKKHVARGAVRAREDVASPGARDATSRLIGFFAVRRRVRARREKRRGGEFFGRSCPSDASGGRARSVKQKNHRDIDARHRARFRGAFPSSRATSAPETRALESLTVRATFSVFGTGSSLRRAENALESDPHLLPTRVPAEPRLDHDHRASPLEVRAPIARAPPRRLNLGRDEVAERRGRHRERFQ